MFLSFVNKILSVWFGLNPVSFLFFQMSPMINKQIDKFLHVLDEKCVKEEDFNIYEWVFVLMLC